MFPENQKKHEMQTGKHEKYRVQHANTASIPFDMYSRHS